MKLPVEVILASLAWMHPCSVLKYRRLSRCFNERIASRAFALTSLSKLVPLTPARDAEATPELSVFWLFWPSAFQFVYSQTVFRDVAELNLAHLSKRSGLVGDLARALKRFKPTLPAGIGAIADLATLNLAGNSLSGPIPIDLFSLKNLRNLDLSSNGLTGSMEAFSDMVGELTRLEFVMIGCNRFTPGPIPLGLASLNKLKCLGLQNTNRVGEIPASLFENWSQLFHLSLENNQLNGKIPKSVSRMRSLKVLGLAGNRNLFQQLPREVLDLPDLRMIDLDAQLPRCVRQWLARPFVAHEDFDLSDEEETGQPDGAGILTLSEDGYILPDL